MTAAYARLEIGLELHGPADGEQQFWFNPHFVGGAFSTENGGYLGIGLRIGLSF